MSDLLRDWYQLKQKIAALQAKETKIRQTMIRLMKEQNTQFLSAGEYSVKLTDSVRSSLSKKDCPPEIWDRYSKKTQVQTCQVRKKDFSPERKDDNGSSEDESDRNTNR